MGALAVGVVSRPVASTGVGRVVGWLALVGSLATIAYAGRLTAGKPDRDLLYQYSSAVGSLIQYGLLLGLLLLVSRGLDKRELFALRAPSSVRGALKLGLGALVSIYVVAAALNPFLHAGEEQGLTPERWEPDRLGAYLANAAVIVIVAPFVEELLYRGAGVTLLSRYGKVVAVLGASIAFGLAHGLVEGLPVLAFFGVALAVLRMRTNSVVPGMVLHALFNGVALVAAVAV